jgi:hypothetical protein
LRKNGKAKAISTFNLGRQINRIVCEVLSGRLVAEDEPAFWAVGDSDKNVDEFLLPKTAAQYEVEVESLPELFRKIHDL